MQIKKQKILEKEPDAAALLYSESAGLAKAGAAADSPKNQKVLI